MEVLEERFGGEQKAVAPLDHTLKATKRLANESRHIPEKAPPQPMDLPGKKRKVRSRLKCSMDEPKKADYSISVLVVALSAIVFVLDVITLLGIAIWALYILPLGLTRWSPLGPLTFIVAGAYTALIVLGYLFSPPGTSPDVSIFNRTLGVLMVWIAAFFLKVGRI